MVRNRMKHVKARVFRTTSDGAQFPERCRLGSKADVGVCFSGGGTRSATCTVGQLRALHKLGLIHQIGYVSCVSGGAWCAVPFTFLRRHVEDEDFLGNVMPPERLDADELSRVSPRAYLDTVTHAVVVDDAIAQLIKIGLRFGELDELYSRAISATFLRPFGLEDPHRSFAYDDHQLRDILTRNPKLTEDDFHVVEKTRPFLIATGALLREGHKDLVYEMTPWYVGIGKLYPRAGEGARNIGGGYVESLAGDSDSPDKRPVDDLVRVRVGKRDHRFSLSDVIGTSGAAPSELLDSMGINFVGFPEFKHWPLTRIGNTKAKEYEIGDGGNIENLGVIPLLRRRVKRIIVFVNTKRKLTPLQINSSVEALFTKGDVNHVFAEGDLGKLQSALLNRLVEGKSAIHQATHKVVLNTHHGVEAGDVEVLWVYNQLYKRWCVRLPSGIRDAVGHGKLERFPHFRTFFENEPKVIDLEAVQANLLAHMSCSVLLDDAKCFTDFVTRGPSPGKCTNEGIT